MVIPFSIHTLVGVSAQRLTDLNKHQVGGPMVRAAQFVKHFPPEQVPEFRSGRGLHKIRGLLVP
jgi:hypothetical protein